MRHAQHAGASGVLVADNLCVCKDISCHPDPGTTCQVTTVYILFFWGVCGLCVCGLWWVRVCIRYGHRRTLTGPAPNNPVPHTQGIEPIMADDGSGADITIPSFLLYKPDADAIKSKLRETDFVQVMRISLGMRACGGVCICTWIIGGPSPNTYITPNPPTATLHRWR